MEQAREKSLLEQLCAERAKTRKATRELKEAQRVNGRMKSQFQMVVKQAIKKTKERREAATAARALAEENKVLKTRLREAETKAAKQERRALALEQALGVQAARCYEVQQANLKLQYLLTGRDEEARRLGRAVQAGKEARRRAGAANRTLAGKVEEAEGRAELNFKALARQLQQAGEKAKQVEANLKAADRMVYTALVSQSVSQSVRALAAGGSRGVPDFLYLTPRCRRPCAGGEAGAEAGQGGPGQGVPFRWRGQQEGGK